MALLRSAQHRLTALALVGALALGVSGCGDDSPTPAPSTSSAAASPTPTASGPVAPVLPDLAARHDDVGAKAFVKYWFATLTYATRTGLTTQLKAESSGKCETCSKMLASIDSAYANDGRIESDGWTVGKLRLVHDRSDGAHIYVLVRQSDQTYLDASGATVQRVPAKETNLELLLTWQNGWSMREAALF